MTQRLSNKVQLWLTSTSIWSWAELWAGYGSWLTAAEQARLQRLVRPQARLQALLGRVVITQVLSHYLPGVAPQDLRFVTGPRGKPALHPVHGGRVAFNLSHSHDLLVLGVVAQPPPTAAATEGAPRGENAALGESVALGKDAARDERAPPAAAGAVRDESAPPAVVGAARGESVVHEQDAARDERAPPAVVGAACGESVVHEQDAARDERVPPAVAAELGVDAEWTGRGRRVAAVARRCFAASEATALLALPEAEQLGRFYALWTLKEASLKAEGNGISMNLRDPAFTFGEQPKPAPANNRVWQQPATAGARLTVEFDAPMPDRHAPAPNPTAGYGTKRQASAAPANNPTADYGTKRQASAAPAHNLTAAHGTKWQFWSLGLTLNNGNDGSGHDRHQPSTSHHLPSTRNSRDGYDYRIAVAGKSSQPLTLAPEALYLADFNNEPQVTPIQLLHAT